MARIGTPDLCNLFLSFTKLGKPRTRLWRILFANRHLHGLITNGPEIERHRPYEKFIKDRAQ